MSDTSDDELPPLERLIFAPRPRAAQRSQIRTYRPNSRASSTKPESLTPAEDSDNETVTGLGGDGASSRAVVLMEPTIYSPKNGPIRFKADDSDRTTSVDEEHEEHESDGEFLTEDGNTEPNGNLKAPLFKVLLEVFIAIWEVFSKIGVVLLCVQFFFVACFFVFLGYCAIADRCTISDVYTVRLGTALTAVPEHLYEAYNTVSVGLCEASQLARGSDTAVCLVRNTEARQAMQELGQQLRWAWEAYVIQTVIYGQRLQIAAT